ncbi:hypothetical protein VTN02DRAFT_2737 [Thermoascus thermophilus]
MTMMLGPVAVGATRPMDAPGVRARRERETPVHSRVIDDGTRTDEDKDKKDEDKGERGSMSPGRRSVEEAGRDGDSRGDGSGRGSSAESSQPEPQRVIISFSGERRGMGTALTVEERGICSRGGRGEKREKRDPDEPGGNGVRFRDDRRRERERERQR